MAGNRAGAVAPGAPGNTGAARTWSLAVNGPEDRERLVTVLRTQIDLELLLKRNEYRTVRERRRETESIITALRGAILQRTQPTAPSAPTQRDDQPLFSLTRDGYFVRWQCPSCSHDTFGSIAMVRHHCRTLHAMTFTGQADLLRQCTVPVADLDVPADDPCRSAPLSDISFDDVLYLPSMTTLQEELAETREVLRERPTIKVYEEDVEMDADEPAAPRGEAAEADHAPRVVSAHDTEGPAQSVDGRGDDDADTAEKSHEVKLEHVVDTVAESSEPSTAMLGSSGSRFYVNKRVVIGNTSRFLLPEKRDSAQATHKWTMFVAAAQDDEDISSFVHKVRFFLHPSFAPNDVVEVDSPPFSISRRGWGVFPVRVQLHVGFDRTRTKAVDVIHMLHLERSTETVTNSRPYDVEVERVLPYMNKRAFKVRDAAAEEARPAQVKLEAQPEMQRQRAESPVLAYTSAADGPAVASEAPAVVESEVQPVVAVPTPTPTRVKAPKGFELCPVQPLSIRAAIKRKSDALRFLAFCRFCGGPHLTRVCTLRPDAISRARAGQLRAAVTQLVSSSSPLPADIAEQVAAAAAAAAASEAAARATSDAASLTLNNKRSRDADEDEDEDIDIEADDDALSVGSVPSRRGSVSRRGSLSVPPAASTSARERPSPLAQSSSTADVDADSDADAATDNDAVDAEEAFLRQQCVEQAIVSNGGRRLRMETAAATMLLSAMVGLTRRILSAAVVDAATEQSGVAAAAATDASGLKVIVPLHVHRAVVAEPALDFLTNKGMQADASQSK